MSANNAMPSAGSTKAAPRPVTLAEVVEAVFGRPASTPSRGLGGKLRGVLRKRGDATPPPTTEVVEPSGPRLPDGLHDFLGPAGRRRLPRLTLAPMAAPDDPPRCLRVLKLARRQQAQGGHAAWLAQGRAEVMREIEVRAVVLRDLTRAYPRQSEQLLAAAEVSMAALQQAIDGAPAAAAAARRKALTAYDVPLTCRVDAALALLASPTIRGAVPEAATLRSRAAALAALATALAEVAELVDEVETRRDRRDAVLALLPRLDDADMVSPWRQTLNREEQRLGAGLAELRMRTAGLRFPEHGVDNEFVMPAAEDDGYALNDLQLAELGRDENEISIEVLDDVHALNVRVLLALAELTGRVERGLKLEPLRAIVQAA